MMMRLGAALALTLFLAAPAFAQGDLPPPPEEVPGAEVPPGEPLPPPDGAGGAGAVTPTTPTGGPGATLGGKKYASQGVIEVAGGLLFNFTKRGDYDSWTFGIGPRVNYFVINGLGVGGLFDMTFGKGGYKSISLVPGAEYHFDLGSVLYPYAGLGFGFQYLSIEDCTSGVCVSASDTNALVDFGGGVKIIFGNGGILGFGLDFPIVFTSGDPTISINLLTRYGVYF